MKLRNTARKFKTWIASLWRPRVEFDWVQLHYDLMASVDSINEERISVLIAERDRLKKAKKRHLHIQAEIESLRAEQLRSA